MLSVDCLFGHRRRRLPGNRNPNDVTVTHDFESEDAAKALLSSAELKGAMENAGVVGEPQVWITSPG